MSENKTINLKINSNTKEATKDTQDYNKALGGTKKQYDKVLKSGDSYEKQLSDINKIVKETPLNVRDMNKQIQAYQSIALSAGRETPVGKEALQKASELRDRYIDIQNETKRLADDQKNLQGAIQLVGTGVAAFGGVQSAMALTGVESEKLRETMVKLQAAQTLMNSINTIATALEKESSAMLLLKSARTKALTTAQVIYTAVTGKATKATKLFKVALASTGIGLIVLAVGALIANFDKLTSVFKPVIDGLKAIGDAIGLTNFAADEKKEKLKKQAEYEAELAAKELESHNARMDQYRKEQAEQDVLLGKEIELAEARGEDTTEMQKAQLEKRLKDLQENLAKEEKAYQDAEGDMNSYYQKNLSEAQKAMAFLQKEGASDIYQLSNESRKEFEKTFSNATAQSTKSLQQQIDNATKGLTYQAEVVREKFGKTTQQEINVAQKNIEIFNAKTTASEKNEQKKKADNYRNYLQERLSAERKIEDLRNSLMEDGIEKELDINEDKFRRLREDAKKNTKLTAKERRELNDLYTEQEEQSEAKIREKYDKIERDREKKRLENIAKQNNDFLDTIAEIEEQNYQNTLSDEERELRAVQDKYFALEEAAQGNADALNQIEIARLNELNDIYNKYQKPIDDKKIADEQAVADAKKSIQDKQIANIEAGISLLKDVAGENNKLQALAIAAENAVGIAKIIISTQAANAAAKLKYAAIPGGLALAASEITANKISAGIGIAASVAAAAKGIASLKQSASLDSGGDLGGGPGGGGTEAVAPSFNVVGDSGINQIAQLQQQPVQAFVVSGEVTTSQALDRNRVQNATL